jgi:hypothetical protein
VLAPDGCRRHDSVVTAQFLSPLIQQLLVMMSNRPVMMTDSLINGPLLAFFSDSTFFRLAGPHGRPTRRVGPMQAGADQGCSAD